MRRGIAPQYFADGRGVPVRVGCASTCPRPPLRIDIGRQRSNHFQRGFLGFQAIHGSVAERPLEHRGPKLCDRPDCAVSPRRVSQRLVDEPRRDREHETVVAGASWVAHAVLGAGTEQNCRVGVGYRCFAVGMDLEHTAPRDNDLMRCRRLRLAHWRTRCAAGDKPYRDQRAVKELRRFSCAQPSSLSGVAANSVKPILTREQRELVMLARQSSAMVRLE